MPPHLTSPSRGEEHQRPLRLAAILLPLILLTACADIPVPSWLTGEPDSEVLNAPRAVGNPPSQNVKGWPNLSSVPERPKDFTPPPDRRTTIEGMSADKAEAEGIRERVPSPSTPITNDKKP